VNNIWTFTKLSIGVCTIGCKWVYKNKFSVDGSFQLYKATLVIKGFHQIEGFDHIETFSQLLSASFELKLYP